MIEELLNSALIRIGEANSSKDLQDLKVEFLGKSGFINIEMSKLSRLTGDDKKEFGIRINDIKNKLNLAFEQSFDILRRQELDLQLKNESLDLSAPGRMIHTGSIHPITQCLEELIQIFSKYGFNMKEGPDIEDDWHNFTALNIDENHPARQMHDTFYLNQNKLLRTQTSPIQIRTMMNEQPPFSFIAPGRTYRSDYDATHTPMFHQIEGLYIDKSVNMGHLKYIITDFINEFFEKTNIEFQFRPSFFPFTEPSAEVDIKIGGGDKWLEVLGCGMVHPSVLKNVGIDPDEYSGFAFGLGLERFAMLKYNIKDLREFFEGDIRWLKHYNFKSFDIPSLFGGLTR